MSPTSLYTRVEGRSNTIGIFYPMLGAQQSIGADGGIIDLNTYHTKIYTTDKPITLKMANGLQHGQIKKITLVLKGTESSIATVNCPGMTDYLSKIVFYEKGDQCTLLWTGGTWVSIETLNTEDVSLQSPVVM